tara:strand:- start:263 stop:607 length:345 start_codon:yes stop_codon:yes gene_type:complete
MAKRQIQADVKALADHVFEAEKQTRAAPRGRRARSRQRGGSGQFIVQVDVAYEREYMAYDASSAAEAMDQYRNGELEDPEDGYPEENDQSARVLTEDDRGVRTTHIKGSRGEEG